MTPQSCLALQSSGARAHATLSLAQDPRVTMQLVSSDGDCLTAEFGTAKTNSGTIFQAP